MVAPANMVKRTPMTQAAQKSRTDVDDVIAAAQRYITEFDWHVFPADLSWNDDKNKYNKKSRWKDEYSKSGLKWGMTQDLDEFKKGLAKWPPAVGIPTGSINNFWVCETDTKEGGHGANGEETFQKLIAERGALPDTRRARSPSGSIHYYFSWPTDGGPPIKNTTSKIGPGIDTRGEGGMVAAPPSVRGDGKYELINDNPILPAPDWLVALARGASRSTSSDSASTTPNHPADPADIDRCAAMLAVITNPLPPADDRPGGWEDWNAVGMAIYLVVGGSDDGLGLYKAWSAKCADKNDDDNTAAKWNEYHSYPPTRTGEGKLTKLANEANRCWPVLIGNTIEKAIEIVKLAALPTVQYDPLRKDAAKRLEMRVGTLDDLVERLRPPTAGDGADKQGQEISFKATVPWPDAVDGAALVNDMIGAHRKHVIMSEHGALAVALWEIHAHALDAAEHTPRLQIKSPTYRCGKTTLLRIISTIVPKPVSVESITMAALFRLIELCQPTILIDEAETVLKRADGKTDNEELRGILNSGHRRGGGVIRTVGDDFEPRLFHVFSPTVFCWLVRRGEQVAQTIADRSIVIELRRKLRNEKTDRLRSNRVGHLSVLGRRAARWVADNIAALTDADPVLPDSLHDRSMDNWRALIAIADAISKDLGEKARAAALAIDAEATTADDDTSLLALADVADVFAKREATSATVLSSEAVVQALVDLTDRPWRTWRKGVGNGREPINKHGLARLLKPFGARPKSFRTKTGDVVRGYEARTILDAKARFVDTETGLDLGYDLVVSELTTGGG
jgi:Protein of unknown function (DUF3631)/Bifunctional DNA primase/polymerase, N-terminal/Primase C terminal 2 (PriCT-2)